MSELHKTLVWETGKNGKRNWEIAKASDASHYAVSENDDGSYDVKYIENDPWSIQARHTSRHHMR